MNTSKITFNEQIKQMIVNNRNKKKLDFYGNEICEIRKKFLK